jgi:hypothetical protein
MVPEDGQPITGVEQMCKESVTEVRECEGKASLVEKYRRNGP